MMQQLCSKRLYAHQPSLLDLALPVSIPHSCTVRKLFQHVPIDPSSFDTTDLQPAEAAAAIVGGAGSYDLELVQHLRAASRTLFIIYWHAAATEDVRLRWSAFKAGANMVTHCPHAVARALEQVAAQQQHHNPHHLQQPLFSMQRQQQDSSSVTCSCDFCGLPGLSAAEYWQHLQLYHVHADNREGVCQICGRHTHNLSVHIHTHHSPSGDAPEERTGVFALCIIRRPSDGKFLMTQEFAGSGFWVPGGGVDAGETLTEGAMRECWEEAGVVVHLKGILSLESHHGGAWRRAIFWGEPLLLLHPELNQIPEQDAPEQQQLQLLQAQHQANPIPTMPQTQSRLPADHQQLRPCCCPKTLPDFESAGACWVSVSDLQQLPLRSAAEPCRWFAAMSSGEAAELPLYHSLQLPESWQSVFQGFPVVRG